VSKQSDDAWKRSQKSMSEGQERLKRSAENLRKAMDDGRRHRDRKRAKDRKLQEQFKPLPAWQVPVPPVRPVGAASPRPGTGGARHEDPGWCAECGVANRSAAMCCRNCGVRLRSPGPTTVAQGSSHHRLVPPAAMRSDPAVTGPRDVADPPPVAAGIRAAHGIRRGAALWVVLAVFVAAGVVALATHVHASGHVTRLLQSNSGAGSDGAGSDGHIVSAVGANVRAGPSQTSERVHHLPVGAQVRIACTSSTATGPWDRLVSPYAGRYVGGHLVALTSSVPPC
jgi:hypothetical protein